MTFDRRISTLILSVAAGTLSIGGPTASPAAEPTAAVVPASHLTFLDLPEADQISGIGRVGRFLVVGIDEGRVLLILEPGDNANTYRLFGEPIELPAPAEEEADIEGIAVRDGTVFAVGSHSLKRKKPAADKKYTKNRKRLATVEPEADPEVVLETSRDGVYRVQLDPETGAVQGEIKRIDLRGALAEDPFLKRFTAIPSKENGVDIEGIADDGERLYLGFRGPVLRQNYVPVMVVDFDKPDDYELRFLDLGGDGIRDLARVADGFLVLSGPVGDATPQAGLYFWNGADMVPGDGHPNAHLVRLASLPAPPGAKAEGILVTREDAGHCTVLVVHDGVPGGHPTLFDVQLPTS